MRPARLEPGDCVRHPCRVTWPARHPSRELQDSRPGRRQTILLRSRSGPLRRLAAGRGTWPGLPGRSACVCKKVQSLRMFSGASLNPAGCMTAARGQSSGHPGPRPGPSPTRSRRRTAVGSSGRAARHARPHRGGDGCVAARWSAAEQVPDWPAVHPFGSRQWALAWRNVQTDPVRRARGLQTGRLVAPVYLVDGRPAWAAFEAEAGVGDTWAGRPVVYGPSPYATYGLNVASPWEIRPVVAHGLAWAREAGAVAAVFPGLRHARAWAAVAGGRAVRTTGSHEAPVRGSMAAFKASIGSSRARKEVGRQWRR